MAAKITNVYLLSESKTESTNSCEPRSGMRRQEHAICQLIATRSLGASSRTSASVAFDSEQVTLKTEALGKLMLSIQGVPAVVLSAIWAMVDCTRPGYCQLAGTSHVGLCNRTRSHTYPHRIEVNPSA